AFASGGNKYDIGVGALAGMVISSAGVVPRLRTIFGNPYVPAGASNLIGQVAANIIDPLNNHYSLVSLTFTLYGAGTGNFFSRHVSVPAVKMIIDSMYNWTFSGIGSDLGKRTGW
ncbi:hypothetical protein, partial [Legionella sp.]|uniref:hypothetical protein n=1 Tax=Legionella sp. TaxID=459 RepID=UPI00321FDC0B